VAPLTLSPGSASENVNLRLKFRSGYIAASGNVRVTLLTPLFSDRGGGMSEWVWHR